MCAGWRAGGMLRGAGQAAGGHPLRVQPLRPWACWRAPTRAPRSQPALSLPSATRHMSPGEPWPLFPLPQPAQDHQQEAGRRAPDLLLCAAQRSRQGGWALALGVRRGQAHVRCFFPTCVATCACRQPSPHAPGSSCPSCASCAPRRAPSASTWTAWLASLNWRSCASSHCMACASGSRGWGSGPP